MTLEEFQERYYFHDSDIQSLTYDADSSTLTLVIDFAFWMQISFIEGQEETGLIEVTFRNVSSYECEGGDPTGVFVGILNTEVKDGCLVFHMSDGMSLDYIELRVRAAEVDVKLSNAERLERVGESTRYSVADVHARLKALGPPRKGAKDVWWRPFMVRGALFSPNDIPLCPTTATEIPSSLITYKEAREKYRKELRKGNKDFKDPAFVCFYEADYEFDTFKGIWFRSSQAYKILDHFGGIITPDFSTCQDFPVPLKMWNTYRMRAFGFWYGAACGHAVINNVRWGTQETYGFCFDGIPAKSVVAIGTVGGSPRKLVDRERFEEGLKEMAKTLAPHTIIVYGSANYPCFKELEEQGVQIVAFPSKTSRAFAAKAKRK